MAGKNEKLITEQTEQFSFTLYKCCISTTSGLNSDQIYIELGYIFIEYYFLTNNK